MSLKQTHLFVPANHPHIHYVGRWIPSANNLRRDAAFPGSYMEIIVTNTTSLFLVLNNVYWDPTTYSKLPLADRRVLEYEVGILVEINSFEGEGNKILGIEKAASIIRIADDLHPQKEYKVKITFMMSLSGGEISPQSIQFEGVWLDRPATFRTAASYESSATGSIWGELWYLSPDTQHHTTIPGIPQPPKPIIEIITSEAEHYIDDLVTNYLPANSTKQWPGFWYSRAGAALAADIALVPVDTVGTRFNAEMKRFRDVFFRSGHPGSTYGSLAWSFRAYRPSILILQIGFFDFLHFFKDKSNANRLSVTKFTSQFVDAYVEFVRSIRANAYPFNPDSKTISDVDDSYIYNSAPSTLPIFLLTPFTARNRFVTRKLTLHKFLSDALEEVASILQAQGDKSTHWIDTTGWLNPREDFDHLPSGYPLNRSDFPNVLTPSASIKVATLLADHICPYIKNETGRFATQPAFGDCAFDTYDSYLGNVYVPKDVELDRAVLERKIETIKQKFSLGGPLDGEGERFVYSKKEAAEAD